MRHAKTCRGSMECSMQLFMCLQGSLELKALSMSLAQTTMSTVLQTQALCRWEMRGVQQFSYVGLQAAEGCILPSLVAFWGDCMPFIRWSASRKQDHQALIPCIFHCCDETASCKLLQPSHSCLDSSLAVRP